MCCRSALTLVYMSTMKKHPAAVALKSYMDANDMSCQETGDALDVHRISVWKWLKNKRKPNVKQIVAIAALTGKEIKDLV